MTKHAALIVDNKAHIFEVAHIASGESFDDEAIQYMVERMGVTECDGFAFGESYEEVVAWAADRRITVAA